VPLPRAEGKYIAFQADWKAGAAYIESWNLPADKADMDLPLPLVLCFVFAVVVGYFAGRMMGLLQRD